jgi:hypothetical protein
MVFGMIGRRKTLREMLKLMTRADLSHGQGNCSATMSIMDHDLPNMIRDVV